MLTEHKPLVAVVFTGHGFSIELLQPVMGELLKYEEYFKALADLYDGVDLTSSTRSLLEKEGFPVVAAVGCSTEESLICLVRQVELQLDRKNGVVRFKRGNRGS